MSSLNIEYKGKKIPIAGIDIKSSNENVTFGSLERDLILKTLGKIYVQVGNKYYDLNFNLNGNNLSLNNVIAVKGMDKVNAKDYSNGTFLLEIESSTLFLVYNNKLIELASGSGGSKLYLSYAEEQNLSGSQAHTLVYNAKLNIKSLDEISKFTYDDVYENQVIYVEDQKCHYVLDKYNVPNALTSWRPIYLTTMGGTLYDGLTIYNQSKNYTLALEGLHLEGDNIYKGLRIGTDENYIRTAATTEGIIKTEFNGTALVINRNNNTIFEYNNGNIGIGGKASRGEYNNILYGTSKLTGNLFTNYNIMSDDFQSRNITAWDGGQGYALKKTSIGTWFLEVDDLVVRNSISAEVLNLKELVVDRTYATGGHMMVTDGAKVSKVEYYPNITQENKDQVKHPLKETPINGTLDIGESYYFVYFNDQDKDVDEETGESEYDAGAFCPFIKGDILLCQSFTGLKTKKYYAIVSYSDNYRVAIKYKDFYGSYIIIDADRPSTDFESLNSIDVKDELVRVGNEDPKRISRQKIIDIDGTRNWITMYDNLNSLKYAKDENGDFVYDEEGRKIATDGPLTYDNLKLRIGDLAGLPDHGKGGTAVLPDDVGYGLFADNVYLKGKMVLWRMEDGVEYSEYLGINRGTWDPAAKYYIGDRVTYNGSYYYCAKVSDTGSNVGMNPEDYTDFWTLLVAKGSDGIPGQSVTYINITGLSYFKIDTQDNPDPISITLTANLYNVDIDSLLKTIRYQWVCNNTIVKDITYSDAFDTHLTSTLDIPYRGTTTNPVGDVQKEINWTAIWATANYNTFICNVFINGVQIAVDQFTIYKIKDGATGEDGKPGLTIIASNEALVIPSDYNGYINPNFIGANSQSSCSIDVFSGATKLIYSETETGPDKYKISISSTTTDLISTFFEKANNTFYLIKGHYNSSSTTNPKLPDSFIVNVSIIINGVTYTKKISYGLAKAGQDANLLDWIKEWTGNTTEIQADGIITPKIYVGDPLSKVDNKYVLKNGIYLGRGLNSGEPAQFVGYGGGFRTFELDTKGRFFLGKQITGATATSIPVYQDGGLSFDGNKLIIGNDSTIGGANQTIGGLVNVVNEHKESINNIVGDNYITASEKFKLREIAARISQEYKDVETSLAGLLGITDVSTLPTNSVPFREYKVAYSKFLEDLNYYINANPDADGFIPVISGHNLNTSNNNYYNKLVTVRQEIENQRINRFDKNTANVLRQQTEPLTRGDGSPLQIGDIWISIDASGVDVFSKVVISTNPVVWRFLGDNTGTAIDNGLITTGTIKLTSKTNNQVDKAGITGSNSTIAYFNPSDLSDISITQDSTHSLSSAVRFWSGLTATNQTWNDAPFKVYENGAIFATAGKIGALGINGDNMHVGGPSPFNNIITPRPEPSLLRTKPGLTIKSNGDIVGQDYYLSGDASKRASVFIGDFYFVEQPSNSIYNQFTSVSAGLNALNQKFDSMFSLAFVNIHNGNIIDGSLPEGADPSDYMIQIKAKMSFFSVGGITAKGASASSGNFWKGLPIDPNTLAWDSNDRLTVVGGTGGGGDISLNGTLYKPVNGVITLPNLATPGDITTALSSYATQAWVTDKNYATQSWVNGKGYVTATALATMGFATQAWVNSQGFLSSAALDNYVTLNTVQNITGVKTFSSGLIATDIVANKFKTLSGTSSQFLKADGSVDGNLYALAYDGKQQLVRNSAWSAMLNVTDRRNDTILPETFEPYSISTLFSMSGMPTNDWYSGIQVRGWGTNYTAWSLVGPSSTDNTNNRLYYRDGIADSWAIWWKPIAFLEDVKDVGEVYFDNQDIYVDYGYWVVGLCRLSPVTSEAGINGTMYYNRRNGIYANGSVQFSIQKVYNTSDAYAGVLYNGYGVAFNEYAPKLCTFTYGGVKYCGLKWSSNSSLNTIKTIIHETWGNNAPFYVLYARSNGSNVINAEIKNSIVELGSDIRLKYVSTSSPIYTSSGRIEINSIANGWAYIRYQTNGRYVDTGLSGTTGGLCGLVGNYEIRPTGSDNEGIFVRYSQSDYGKLGVVNRSGQECSIGYFNNNTAVGADKPVWTVGAGMRNATSFDWWYGTSGYRMTLDEYGKLFINRTSNGEGNPAISLAIGDSDTGLHHITDGQLAFYANNKNVGYWSSSSAGLHNVSFREAYNNDYNGLGLMVNGNGTANTVKPGIGFLQPGVYANSLRSDGAGDFRFCVQGGSVGCTVQAANFYANGGWLYSNVNGCEVRIGSQNTSYVHITNNANRPYYFDKELNVSGNVSPYSTNAHDLGDASHAWRNAYISKVYGGANWADYLSNHYIGGQQFNPQTYFGSISIGLKVAMTGTPTNGAYWSDTLWINGYYGTDESTCNALHFPRDGSSEMYISSQTYNATVYGTKYRFWSSKNSNKLDAAWSCSTLNASGRVTCADVYSSSWLRTTGQTGWYSESYGGGIYMNNSNTVNIFNNKVFYNDGYRPWGIGGHHCGLKLYNQHHIGINLANSSYTWGIYSNSDGNMYIGRRDGNVDNSGGSYVVTLGYSTLSMSGNIVATGGITAKTSSDMRLKNRVGQTDYAKKLLSLGLVFDYIYNDTAQSRIGKMVDDKRHIGLSYQAVSKALPTICGKDDDGYGYINYISPDFISLIAGATQLNTLGIKELYKKTNSIEDEIKKLKKENECLKKEINKLKREYR